jgi:hypothetical protein
MKRIPQNRALRLSCGERRDGAAENRFPDWFRAKFPPRADRGVATTIGQGHRHGFVLPQSNLEEAAVRVSIT